jgi:hypothetical protein
MGRGAYLFALRTGMVTFSTRGTRMDIAEFNTLLWFSLALATVVACGLGLMILNNRRMATWTNWHRSS